jgi:hypothetical protein
MSGTDTLRASADDIRYFLESLVVMAAQVANGRTDWRARSLDAFILEHGRAWEPAPLPPTIPMRAPQECFRNSAHLAATHPELRYVQGYGLPARGILPVPHAWVVDDQGRVIDTTWEDGETAAYYGMVVPIASVHQMLLVADQYDFFGSDWLAGHPIRKLWRIPTPDEIVRAKRGELD